MEFTYWCPLITTIVFHHVCKPVSHDNVRYSSTGVIMTRHLNNLLIYSYRWRETENCHCPCHHERHPHPGVWWSHILPRHYHWTGQHADSQRHRLPALAFHKDDLISECVLGKATVWGVWAECIELMQWVCMDYCKMSRTNCVSFAELTKKKIHEKKNLQCLLHLLLSVVQNTTLTSV